MPQVLHLLRSIVGKTDKLANGFLVGIDEFLSSRSVCSNSLLCAEVPLAGPHYYSKILQILSILNSK